MGSYMGMEMHIRKDGCTISATTPRHTNIYTTIRCGIK